MCNLEQKTETHQHGSLWFVFCLNRQHYIAGTWGRV